MHTFQQQLNDSGKIPIFEIEVIDSRTGDLDYIVCNIEVRTDRAAIIPACLEATRAGLTYKEEQSNKVAFNRIFIDLDFSLDHHLEELYSDIITDICSSDFYSLA